MNDGHGCDEPPVDWSDRLVDTSLHELHGSQPPDLSARVLLALQARPTGELPTLRARAPRSWLPWWLALAGAVLLAGFVAVRLLEPRPLAPHNEFDARLDVFVFGGVFDSIEAAPDAVAPAQVVRHAQGSPGRFCARAGNRLRIESQSLAQVGPFGVFAAGPHTEMEVQSMEFTVKQGIVVASTLTLAVVAGVATWYTLGRVETASAGEVLHLKAAADDGVVPPALVAENERLRQRVFELEGQNQALQQLGVRTSVPEVEVVEPPPPPPPEPAVAAAPTVVFDDPRYAEALAAIDWKLVGSVTNEMGPLLAQLVEEMAKTGDVPTELAVKIQELNSKLVAQVPTMLKAGLPGFGPNGSYTHPLVVANTLASTLAAAGQPLNASQQTAIGGLVHAFGVESQSIVDSSADFELEHLLAETEMKDRFFREVSTLLGPDQHQVMYPEGSGAYDGVSLFGTSLITRPYTEGVPANNASDFARLASNKIGEQIGLDEATSSKVRSVVERMVAASPELWQDPADATEKGLRMLKTGRTPAALRRQLAVMREIQRSVPMTPEQLKKLRSMRHILVPLPK